MYVSKWRFCRQYPLKNGLSIAETQYELSLLPCHKCQRHKPTKNNGNVHNNENFQDDIHNTTRTSSLQVTKRHPHIHGTRYTINIQSSPPHSYRDMKYARLAKIQRIISTNGACVLEYQSGKVWRATRQILDWPMTNRNDGCLREMPGRPSTISLPV